MKKLSRILALALSLMMALTCCAFAENTPSGYDSTAYSLSIYDPVVYYNDTPVIDLTGANLDLNLVATDTGLTGLIVNLFAGENYDYVTGATAQLDPTGVTAYLDGMSNTYNADISMMTGVNPYFFMSSVPLRTMLNSLDLSALEGVSFTPEMRVAMAAQMFSSIAGEPNGSVYPISITAEQGRALLESLADYIAQADAETAQEYRAALAEDPAITFALDGSMTYNGSSILVEMNGALTNSSETIPFFLKYSDDMNKIAIDAAIQDEAGETLASLIGESVTGPDANGQTATNALFTFTVDGEDMHFGYTALPSEGTSGTDHTFSIAVPSEEVTIKYLLQTGTHPEGVGFNTGVYVYPGEEYYGIGLQYTGDNLDANGAEVPYHTGYLYTFAETNDESYALELGLMMQAYDVPTADWSLPTEGAVDVLTMDESQQQAAMTEAMTVLQNALPTLMAGVPGLGALMGGTAEMSVE